MAIKLGTLSPKTCCLHWNSNMQEECINRWLGKWILLQNYFSASLHNKLCTITCVMSYYFLNLNGYYPTMIFQPSTHFLIWESQTESEWGCCGLRGAQVRTDHYYTLSFAMITAHNYQANQRKNKDLDKSERSSKIFKSQQPQTVQPFEVVEITTEVCWHRFVELLWQAILTFIHLNRLVLCVIFMVLIIALITYH